MAAYLTETVKVVGALAPIDKAGNAWVSKPINLAKYNRVCFLLYLGADDTTGTITVEKGTASTLGTAIAFNYRKATTGAAAFSVLDAAFAAATSSGIALTASDDNKIMAIEVCAQELGTSNWVGVKVSAAGTANLVTIIALCYEPRFPQDIPADPTA